MYTFLLVIDDAQRLILKHDFFKNVQVDGKECDIVATLRLRSNDDDDDAITFIYCKLLEKIVTPRITITIFVTAIL